MWGTLSGTPLFHWELGRRGPTGIPKPRHQPLSCPGDTGYFSTAAAEGGKSCGGPGDPPVLSWGCATPRPSHRAGVPCVVLPLWA